MSFKELKKIRILVVAGGWSSERTVSINSGKNVFNALKKNGYKVTFFDLRKYNLNELFRFKPNLIFNALHGEFGEDGGISSLAKKYNINFAQMSVKFCEIQPFMTSVIIGATTMEQLKENIESVNINLSSDLIKDLNEIQKIYPNPCP